MSLVKLTIKGISYSQTQNGAYALILNEVDGDRKLPIVIGAFEAQYQLKIAAIGGKDSMSGTFNEINVPPTLVSFAVTTGNANNIISPELKKTNSYIYLYKMTADHKYIPDWNKLKNDWNTITSHIHHKKTIAAKTVKQGGVAVALAKMSFGNKIGFEICTSENLLSETMGSIVFESTELLGDDFILIDNDPEARLEYDPAYAKATFFQTVKGSGKQYSPEELLKKRQEIDAMNQEISNQLKMIPDFTDIEDAKTKINNFLQ